MTKVVGDVAVTVGADIGPLKSGMRKGARELEGFGDRAGKMAARVAKAGAAITAGLAGAAAAGYGLARSAATAGAEIERLSAVAGLAPERFQRMAAGAKSVGIEQDKLADILKDVQDRVGDFIATGGGPMADFFEKVAPQVGVTADQFKKLNSADALQLYVSSLTRANLSQSEMTFYMEAMSSDMTALLPLLRDGGAEMKRLGDEAADAGAVMSNDAVKGSKDMLREFENFENALRNKLTEAILDNKEEIIALVDTFSEKVIPGLSGLIGWLEKLANFIVNVEKGYNRLSNLMNGNPLDARMQKLTPDEITDLNRPTRTPIDPDTLFDPTVPTPGYGPFPSVTDQFNTPPLFGGDNGGGFGDDTTDGASGSDLLLPFVASSGTLEDERDRLSDHLAALGEIVSEGIKQRLGAVSDGYARELEMGENQADAEARLEDLKRRQKLSAVQGVFGDLATLMASENEKIFKIGKAAAVAEATINGYKAAVTAWEKGMDIGGPPVAAAFTAASLAKTGALISSIASQNVGGGSGGGGGGGPGGGATAAASAPANYYFDLQGDTFSRASVQSTLSSALQGEIDRGARVIFSGA